MDDDFGFGSAGVTDGADDGLGAPAAINGDAGGGFDDFGGGAAAAADSDSKGGDDAFGLGDTAQEQSATKLKAWEEEHQKVLIGKSDQERQDKQTQQQTAKSELDAFYQKRTDSVTRLKATNRADEKQYRSDISNTMASGTEWEKVAKYCDLKAKPENKEKQSKTDRMRRLLGNLKHEQGK